MVKRIIDVVVNFIRLFFCSALEKDLALHFQKSLFGKLFDAMKDPPHLLGTRAELDARLKKLDEADQIISGLCYIRSSSTMRIVVAALLFSDQSDSNPKSILACSCQELIECILDFHLGLSPLVCQLSSSNYQRAYSNTSAVIQD